MNGIQTRRHFLASLTAAGVASILGARDSLAGEPPPEVTTIRLRRSPAICTAPMYIAEDLLRAEGFTEIRYIVVPAGLPYTQAIGSGEIDIGADLTAVGAIFRMDGGVPMTVLAGLHAGCYELFVHEPIRTISDLKGKKVGIDILGSPKHLYLAIMAAHVGLDPEKDIEWVEGNAPDPAAPFPSMELFVEGKVDAFLGFPPEPQELRARKIGRVIVNMATDPPWSHYFCCMIVGNREFIHDHPIATRRVLRALLKADEICAAEPAVGSTAAGRSRVHRTLRLRAGDSERNFLCQLARVRSRGLASVLRAPAPGGRHDQVDSQSADRRGHRLALPQRAQARAEGVSGFSSLKPN